MTPFSKKSCTSRAYLIAGDEQSVARGIWLTRTLNRNTRSCKGCWRAWPTNWRGSAGVDGPACGLRYAATELFGLRRSGQAEAQLAVRRTLNQLVLQLLVIRHDLQRDVQAALVEISEDYSVRTSRSSFSPPSSSRRSRRQQLAGDAAVASPRRVLISSSVAHRDRQPGTLHPLRLPVS